MKKVDLSSWGGTKVRNNLKKVWPLASLPSMADAEFGTYQQSIAQTIDNTNELVDWKQHIEGVLARRPF